ncbi:MAG: hypothetical protein CVV44_11430 [Spirochaetae bacterium HGW-Spirochaetae-1]|jgi:nucleotide-binding universal stress UspA family protein|nr:MAG: hypothetical protein CVV44_11430 [Spirochaetae bacterium HGW-Spirochaetae-1]
MNKTMKILVALQFTESPDEILDRALSVAKKYEAEIYTIHVIEEMPRISFYSDAYKLWEEFRDHAVKETLKEMTSYIGKLSDQFKKIEPIIVVGSACDKILETAEKIGADLIIIGHHVRKGVFTHMIHNNIAEKIIRNAEIPVLTFNIRE